MATGGTTGKISGILRAYFGDQEIIPEISRSIMEAIHASRPPTNMEAKMKALRKFLPVSKNDRHLAEMVAKELNISVPTMRTIRNWKARLRQEIAESGSIQLTENDVADVFFQQLQFYKDKLAMAERDEIRGRQMSIYRMIELEDGAWTELRDKDGNKVTNPSAVKEQRYMIFNAQKQQQYCQYNIRCLMKDTGNFVSRSKVEEEVHHFDRRVVLTAIRNIMERGIKIMSDHNIPDEEITKWKRYIEEMLR